MTSATKTALIADDHGLFRTGISLLLKDRLGFDRVLEAGSFDLALDLLAQNPDTKLALFDLSMPGMGGASSLASVRETYPDLTVAIISATEDRATVVSAVSVGLAGFIPKSLEEREIEEAINGMLSGRIFVPAFMTLRRPASGGHQQAPSQAEDHVLPSAQSASEARLTPRQKDVLACICQGLTNKEIARQLDIAEGTVKIHLAALFAQYQARNRTELASIALGKGPGRN